MTSKERKELRYQRRKQKRINKLIEDSKKYSRIEKSFTFHKVMFYADKCTKGVNYKRSTQYFKLHMFTIIATTCKNIKNNTYKVGNTYKFKINERGKERLIDAPYIKDRLVHKVLSNEILPIYHKHFIYDNGASIKGKGLHMALKRLKNKLYSHYLKYGTNGYIVKIDFSKYFQNCNHEIIKKIHQKYILNYNTIKILEDYLFINNGLSLGIEIAQKEALMLPNKLDHLVQNKHKIIRYMDDTIYITKTKKEAIEMLNKYIILSKKLGIIINKNKTKIINIKNSFIFCKWKFKILNNGKILMIPVKDTIYRQRRKLVKMYNKKVNINEINKTIICFKSYLNIGSSYKYIKHIDGYVCKKYQNI